MVSAANTLQFELSTGILYADQAYVDRIEDGKAPPNLVQLLEMGKLLVSAATEPGQADTGNGEIVPLTEVLQGELHKDISAASYEHLYTREWDIDDYVAYGQWLDSLTKDPRQVKTQLSRTAIRRAYYIGIGPSDQTIADEQRFGSLTAFYDSFDAVPRYALYKYDSWSPQDLANYAEEVFLQLQELKRESTGPVLSLSQEIERRAQLGLGPAMWIYKRNGDGLMKIMTINGYVDTENMTPEDYVQLGVKIKRANDGKELTASVIKFLSRSRRAPSWHHIGDQMSWADYTEQVQAAYEEQEALRKQSLAQKLLAIKYDRTLPHAVIKGAPAMDMIARHAMWRVVGSLLPSLDPEDRKFIAENVGADNFASVVCAHADGKFKIADIREMAKSLGVYEDIWPDKAYMDYLRVPAQLLEPGSSVYLENLIKGRHIA